MKIHLHIVFLQRPIPTSPLSSPKSQKIYRDRQLSTSVADSQKLQQTMDVSHWIFLGTPKDSRLRIVSTVKDTLLAWFPNFAVAFRLSTFHISTLCHNFSHWKIWSFWSILSIPPKLPRTPQFCQMGNHKQPLIWPPGPISECLPLNPRPQWLARPPWLSGPFRAIRPQEAVPSTSVERDQPWMYADTCLIFLRPSGNQTRLAL
jgi:hypothetical protein